VNVDELMSQITLEQVAAYYNVPLPELHRIGAETRTRCFLTCGRTCETGDRVLAIQTEHCAKQWHCHQYGCGKGGNLVSLCDLIKPGVNGGGRPRGDRFKEIAADLQAMVGGATRAALQPERPAPAEPAKEKPQVNVPLKDSDNERARQLVNLDDKFKLDVATMPPPASAYFRRRSFLSLEVCGKWRAGYLSRDTGGDHGGGTMRGKIVYAYLSESGDVLTWFGRDPEFEVKHQKWIAGGKVEKEPEKFHFVKGFHRGLELFGQHALAQPDTPDRVRGLGLVVVEGPNDVIRLDTLGVPAVALCSNRISREQAAKAARLAREFAGGIVTVFLDCDPEGEEGMKQCLGYLAQLCPVRLAWTSRMFRGKFKQRQPESLMLEEWREISEYLRTGEPKSWSLQQ
jgi:5S rRNA maturation endonuclease (ribonuclease M5)